MIKYISTTTYMLDFDVVGLKTKLEFESVVVLLTLSCPTSLGSTLLCAVDEVEGGSLHVLLSSSPLVLRLTKFAVFILFWYSNIR